MTPLSDLSPADLQALHARVLTEYGAFRARGLRLDMTRGKPSPEQLDLADAMLALPGDGGHFAGGGEDARNYGGLQGLPECRALFAPVLGAAPERVVVGDNSSLALMHDAAAWAMLHGVPGGARPWGRGEPAPAFLCPVPGYDRHFAICEALGIRMVPVPLTGEGPDMAEVERLAADPAVKGMWCVPRYSNPTGETYGDDAVRRLAAMPAGAPDFRLFWDDAYAVHHLTDRPRSVPNVLDECAAAGNPDRAFVFASTSKGRSRGRAVALAAEAGVRLTPAGATWPGGADPHDRTLRLAPSFPPLAEVRAAAEGVATCILLAAIESFFSVDDGTAAVFRDWAVSSLNRPSG